MNNSTLKLSSLAYENLRPPKIHSKLNLKKTSYSILKNKKQNITSNYSKTENTTQTSHISTIYYRDSKVKLIYFSKQVQKSASNDFLRQQQSIKKNKKAQTEIQQMKTFIQEYTIKNISSNLNKRYIYGLYRGVKYSLQKLKPPSQQYLEARKVELYQPTAAKDKFLFLDLDQTLIFAEKSVNYISTNQISYKMSIRPYVFTFLQKLSSFYEIYVFTSAAKAYAQAAIRKLNKKHVYIKDFLSRQHCIQTKQGRFLKDLRIIKNRALKDIVIVDNLVQSFGVQLDNGVPILSFDGYTQDDELLKLIPFLQQLSKKNDVRPHIRQKFKLQKFLNFEKAEIQQMLGIKTN